MYLHVIGVIIVALEEPHPTGTGAGTAAHLLFVHPLSIDVQVTVTIGIGIDSLYFVRCQMVVTIFQFIASRIRIQELQQIRTRGTVKRHQVVLVVSDIDIGVSCLCNIDIIIGIVDFVIEMTCRS